MRSFTERLPQVASAAELREVMRELVQRGSPNWTYHLAAHYVAPELWEDLADYFDDNTGRPCWPAADQLTSAPAIRELPISSLSELMESFHRRLQDVTYAPIDVPDVETGSGAHSSAQEEYESFAESMASATVDDQPVALMPSDMLATEEYCCTICEKTVMKLGEFRGKAMCLSCAALLRGY